MNTVYLALAQAALTAQTPLDILNPSPIDAEEGEDQEEERKEKKRKEKKKRRQEKKGGKPEEKTRLRISLSLIHI